MGFFAGKLGSKSVFSINTTKGGAPSDHTMPNGNTIFHSDMPYVMVVNTYEANLEDVGVGFYSCEMPWDIVQQYSANPGGVVIAVLEYAQGSDVNRTVIQGTSTFHGQFQSGWESYDINMNRGNGEYTFADSSGFSRHIDLDVGTYIYDPNIGHVESIARIGTGGLVQHEVLAKGGGPGPNWLAKNRNSALVGMGYRQGATSVPIDGSSWHIDPDWCAPLGPTNRGHTRFYVSKFGIRGMVTACRCSQYGAGEHNMLFWANSGDAYTARIGPDSIRRSAQRAGKGSWEDFVNFDITPIKIIWYVTNLQFMQLDNGGFTYQVNKVFNNSGEIKISKDDFTIGGVNLGNVGWKFINQTSSYNQSRGDMDFVGLNTCITDWNQLGNDRGICGFVGSNRGTMHWTGNQGGLARQLSIYKFGMHQSWWVNSQSSSIGNNYGEVWGPNQVPLKLFEGSYGGSVIGDSITPIVVSNGGYYPLGTIGLALPATDAATVILTTQHFSGALHKIAGGGTSTSNSIWRVQARNKVDYTGGDTIFHQILTLPINIPVPFHSARLYAVSSLGSGTAEGRMSMFFVITNKGNGTAEIGVLVRGQVHDANVFLPSMRLYVQRLA